jgi:MYXO-CTERM domain-containing protein
MTRNALPAFALLLLLTAIVATPTPAEAQPVKNRISVMVDSSGSMLLTPEIVTYTETCATTMAWNPCNGNNTDPNGTQAACNACVVDTVNFRPSCANSWTPTCANDYVACLLNVTGQTVCSPTMTASDGIATRGDGSADLPGCDLNGDGVANDSRMFQAKEAIADVVATFGEVEFSLWRYAQVTGGQTCSTNGECPDTPGGLSILDCENHDGIAGTSNVCAFDADRMDGATTAGFEGQCNRFTHTGSPSTFTCTACDYNTTYNRAACMMYDLDRVRSGATSLLDGSAVQCFPSANPTHRYMRYHGAVDNNNECDPTGGQQLVAFPATGYDDNYSAILEWIDHVQSPFSSTNELRPQGGTPIAASLVDMRASILADATADTKTPCRKHQVIFLTDGGESCDSVAEAVTAAQSFQNLSFTNAAGIDVTDYDVPVYIIGFAICPPGDPNCQTLQDLNSIAAAGGTGQAIAVSSQLELQLALAQIVADSIVSERCNGADDDCDGAVDEDFPGLGNACSEGVGACYDPGNLVCTADQSGVECDAVAGAPSAEICNNLDDDCDGLIDDGISCTGCQPVCTDAAGCDICNGIDEDCDTIIDEDFTPGACGVDIGACSYGTTTCVGGVVGCSGGQGPVTEACNGIDDDCDTIVDGMSSPCYPPATAGCDLMTGTCQGICGFGVATCDDFPSTPACVGAVTPIGEIACNLTDDDCDGLVDEGAGPEQCNGVDDDCDGSIDEGVAVTDPDIGDACGTPPFIGACQPGAIACIAGAQQCVGEIDPTTETCNNLDDDCDGTPDDNVPGFGGACGTDEGACTPGTLRCIGGAPVCDGATGPFAEVCDGVDNNCNTFTDETDPDLGDTCNTLPDGTVVPTETGECQWGVRVCAAGDLGCVGTIGPVAEICNTRDDDCDGPIDEDFPLLGTTCTAGVGVCEQPGIYVCDAGGAQVCNAQPSAPGVETCNGQDDDCDTFIDEGTLPLVGEECSPGVGMCMGGIWECIAGDLVCSDPASGNPETCDNTDEDCDGFIDEGDLEGEGEDCTDPGFESVGDTGTCEFGETVCTNGGIECDGYIGPGEEVCNGLDDDCDGVADDMAACPVDGQVCHEGACVEACAGGEFPCPTGYVCETLTDVTPPGDYCVTNPCNGVTCESGFYCDSTTGTCVDLCADVSCRTGEECRNGFCLDCFDLPGKCMPGELCIADEDGVGQCEDNLCDPNPCAVDQVCTDGTCSGGCADGCDPGQVCLDGSCEADLCFDVDCPAPQICDPNNGECQNPMCDGVRCNPGEICVPTSGECIADPCDDTVCPMGLDCLVDDAGRPTCGLPPAPEPDRVTAAGSGCQAGGGDAGTAGWLGLALAALLGARRRRPRRARGGAAEVA